MPGGADLTARIAGLEQTAELGVVVDFQAFVGDGHQLADPVERIGLAAPMPAGLVPLCRARDLLHPHHTLRSEELLKSV